MTPSGIETAQCLNHPRQRVLPSAGVWVDKYVVDSEIWALASSLAPNKNLFAPVIRDFVYINNWNNLIIQ
jgi:hypothetical protein